MFSTNDEQGLSQAIVDTVREPVLVLDGDLRVVAASRSFYAKFKVDPENTEGRLLRTLGDGQWDIAALADQLKTIVPDEGVLEGFEVELPFPEIGRRIMLLNARKVYYEHGDHVTVLLAFEDVTDRRVAERERDRLLLEKELMLEEMQHRVANSLQIIGSILLMKARAVGSEETRTHLHDAHKRVLAIAAVQRHLHPTAGNEMVAMQPYLTQLCMSLAGSMVGERSVTINPVIGEADEKSRSAVSIGLIVTELVINALKHAFPVDRQDARIDVLYVRGDRGWQLTVSDNGTGKVGVAMPNGGLGASIVAALADQLGASLQTETSASGMSVSLASLAKARVISVKPMCKSSPPDRNRAVAHT